MIIHWFWLLAPPSSGGMGEVVTLLVQDTIRCDSLGLLWFTERPVPGIGHFEAFKPKHCKDTLGQTSGYHADNVMGTYSGWNKCIRVVKYTYRYTFFFRSASALECLELGLVNNCWVWRAKVNALQVLMDQKKTMLNLCGSLWKGLSCYMERINMHQLALWFVIGQNS